MPIAKVQMPDGRIARFEVPEGTTPEQVTEFASQMGRQEEPAQPKQSYTNIGSGLSQDISKRESEIQRFNEMQKRGEISPAFKGVLSAGEAAGAGLDVVSAGLKAADYTLGGLPSAAIKGVGGAIGSIPLPGDNTVGSLASAAAQNVGAGYAGLKQKMPLTMEGLEAVGNIAAVIMPTPAKAAGQRLAESGVKKSASWVDDLVMPKTTPKFIEERAAKGMVSQPALGSRQIAKTANEELAAEAIKNIPGVSKFKTLANNQNIIRKEAYKQAGKLYSDLEKSGVVFPKREVSNYLKQTAVKNIMENPMITTASGSSETARKLVAKFDDILAKSNGTPSSMLAARREFDSYAKQFRSNVFDAPSQNAYTVSTQEIRNALNDFIEMKAPQVEVKQQLKKSHVLFEAADNIVEKIPGEADTAIKRIIEKIPGKTALGKLSVGGAGLAAAATGATLAPGITAGIVAGAGGLYLGGKLVNSGTARKYLGQLMKAPGANKADVAALQDYMEYLRQQEDETLKQPAKSVINNSKEVR